MALTTDSQCSLTCLSRLGPGSEWHLLLGWVLRYFRSSPGLSMLIEAPANATDPCPRGLPRLESTQFNCKTSHNFVLSWVFCSEWYMYKKLAGVTVKEQTKWTSLGVIPDPTQSLEVQTLQSTWWLTTCNETYTVTSSMTSSYRWGEW